MVRLKSQSSPLMSYYALLEEALEFGDHVLTDKLVYLSKFIVGNSDPFALVSELNTDLDRWLEVKLTLRGEGKPQYLAVIRPANDGLHVGWVSNRNIGTVCVERYPSMFVDVPEPMQAPQFSAFVSTPAVVWLQRLNNLHSINGDAPNVPRKCLAAFAAFNPDDREGGSVVRSPAMRVSEKASQVIKGGAETRDDISCDQCEPYIWGAEVNVRDVLSSFKIIVERNRIWLALQKDVQFFIQSAEVMLRPTTLQAGIEIAGASV